MALTGLGGPYAGKTQTLVTWAEETGLTVATIRGRLKRKWTVGAALGREQHGTE